MKTSDRLPTRLEGTPLTELREQMVMLKAMILAAELTLMTRVIEKSRGKDTLKIELDRNMLQQWVLWMRDNYGMKKRG